MMFKSKIQDIPSRHTFLIVGIILCVAGTLTSPNNFQKAGILERSLASSIEVVQVSTVVEIILVKIIFYILGVLMICVYLYWKPLTRSTAYRKYLSYNKNLYPDKLEANWLNFVFFIILITGLIFYPLGIYFDREEQYFAAEDGLVEYMSASFFFLASLLAYINLKNNTLSRKEKSNFFIFFLALLFITGEEISWGQRLFDIQTTSVFEAYNLQKENNIHNLFGNVFDHLFILVTFLIGVLIPLLSYKYKLFYYFFHNSGISIASKGLSLGFLIITLLQADLLCNIFGVTYEQLFDELREFLSSIAYFLLMTEQYFHNKSKNQHH